MSTIADYLRLGLYKGLTACQAAGTFNTQIFKDNCANLSGEAIILDENTIIINDYPTNRKTIESLEFQFYDILSELNVTLSLQKKFLVIKKK